jgi:hypothetical protein
MTFTEEKAAHLYASAWNMLDFSDYFQVLNEDCIYSSQYVLGDLESKKAIVDYLSKKVDTIIKTAHRVVAKESVLLQGADLSSRKGRAAVALYQGESDEVSAVVLFDVNENSVIAFKLCMPELYKVQVLDQ